MYTLTATNHTYREVETTRHATRREAVIHAYAAHRVRAHEWTALGMDVNEINLNGSTYRITDPDGTYRRYPAVR